MIQHGVHPVLPDHRDRSFPRTFGAISSFPDELNLDAGLGFPDQNTDGRPQSCRAYAQTDLCADEDHVLYRVDFTDEKQCLMEDIPTGSPGDIRKSLASLIVYGAQAKGETTDEQAGYHRRGAYYAVIDSPDLDAFDDVRSAILTNKRSVSVATPWFAEWENIKHDGIVPLPLSKPASYHNWKICGWKKIQGDPYLIGKSWQGPHYGDGGYHYVSRGTFNAVMAMPGTGAFTVRKALASDYATVRMTIVGQVLEYIRMWLTNLA